MYAFEYAAYLNIYRGNMYVRVAFTYIPHTASTWGFYYDRFCRSAAREKRVCKKPTAATMALWAACSGIANKI